MGLSLVLGPAHTGKVAALLDRYVATLDRDPWLIVPNRRDVERVERDLLRRRGVLLAGRIGTFDDLFEHVVRASGDRRPVASDLQSLLALRRALGRVSLGGRLAAVSAASGFVDSLHAALAELGSALLDPGRLDGDLGTLAAAHGAELERLGLVDRATLRRVAVERLATDIDAWGDAPVHAYGFEDLTGVEWALVEALAARTDVVVSIPYEPGRPAFAALERTVADLSELARGAVVELSRQATGRTAPPALVHLERFLFADAPLEKPELDGSLLLLEGAGLRGTAELVGKELRNIILRGVPAERIGIVCDAPERWRSALATALDPLGIPYEVEHSRRLPETPLGRALLALLRFAWLGGGRPELFSFLRSPFSGLELRSVDYVEGRLRGRAVVDPACVEEETERLRGAPVPALVELRAAASPTAAIRGLVRTMVRNAWGLESPPVEQDARDDARAAQAVTQVLDELDAIAAAAGDISREELVAALERTRVRLSSAGERGRVAVLDYARARTRAFDVVFLLGLEEGGVPRRESSSPLLDDDARRVLGGRLERPDPVARDRYLFYTACTRATTQLVLVRQATSDDGIPRVASPFWDEVVALFDAASVARHTRRRSLADLTWPLEEAPSERERLRSLARIAATNLEEAATIAAANGWTRRLQRARDAFARGTRLSAPTVLGILAPRTTFPATELERFADCSAAWLVERVIDPKKVDAEPDALLRGSVMHTALQRFYVALPRELHADRVTPENVEAALELMHRCVDDALQTGVRFDLTPVQAAELRQTLLVDLEGFVRDEASSKLTFVPRRLEVGFGSDRAAPELQRGLALGDGLYLSGKIDRVDIDPFSARGIVQDYKSGKGAHSAREIERELRLQIPLYVLALRDLLGVEPLGGVYRALAGRRTTRGMLREAARDDLPGFAKDDYLDEETFWAQVEVARERAVEYAQRIRAGDVRHDPKGGECPAWCDLWPMCRVARP